MKKHKIKWYEEGASGKMGSKVFYQRNGKTFKRKAPGSYNVVATEKQAAYRSRFTEALAFARSIIADPVLKAEYEQRAARGRSAYNVAMSEFLKRR